MVTSQIVYETNIDFERTEEKLRNSGLLEAAGQNPNDKRGAWWFKFRDIGAKFLFFPSTRTLQVKFSDAAEKKVTLKILTNLAVSLNGDPVVLQAIHQQPIIPYPAPKDFELFWCDESTTYSQIRPESAETLHARAELEKQRNLTWALDALAGYHEPVYFRRLDQKKE